MIDFLIKINNLFIYVISSLQFDIGKRKNAQIQSILLLFSIVFSFAIPFITLR